MKRSFEFYVPKNPDNYPLIRDKISSLSFCEFISITDGTGSASSEQFLSYLLPNVDSSLICPHISYMYRDLDSTSSYLSLISKFDVRSLFLIRGSSWASSNFSSLDDAVDLVRSFSTSYNIYSSFYPDSYPGYTLDESVIFSIKKVSSGCSKLISQWTPNLDQYLYYRDRLDHYSLGHVLIPSLLPLINDSAKRIAERIVGSTIDSVPSEQFAIDQLNSQISFLKSNGFEHVHIFTLNHTHFLNQLEF